MNKRFKAAIFDVDGTLLNSSEMWRELGARYLDEKGIAYSEELSQSLSELSLDEGARLLANEYTKTAADIVKRELYEKMARFYRREVQPKLGAAELVKSLKARNIPMALATAGDADLAWAALERLGLCSAFCGITDCAQYGAKTSANVFVAAAKLCGAAPQECIVFEDSLHAVIAAKSAGFFTVAVSDISEPRQEELKKSAQLYAAELSEYVELFRE